MHVIQGGGVGRGIRPSQSTDWGSLAPPNPKMATACNNIRQLLSKCQCQRCADDTGPEYGRRAIGEWWPLPCTRGFSARRGTRLIQWIRIWDVGNLTSSAVHTYYWPKQVVKSPPFLKMVAAPWIALVKLTLLVTLIFVLLVHQTCEAQR